MSQNNPVVLIHGFKDTKLLFNRMSDYLKKKGYSVHSLNLIPNNGKAPLEKLADQVADYVETTFSPSQTIDLVGFSMGGIISRYYLQKLGGNKRVERFISIAAPNKGTLTAYFLPLPGIVQMRPHSPFLLDLNQEELTLLEDVNVTVIWTPFDLMIIPAHSSQMSIAREVKLPVSLHALMATDFRVMEAVVEALETPVKKKNDLQLKIIDEPQKPLQNDDKT